MLEHIIITVLVLKKLRFIYLNILKRCLSYLGKRVILLLIMVKMITISGMIEKSYTRVSIQHTNYTANLVKLLTGTSVKPDSLFLARSSFAAAKIFIIKILRKW